MIVVVNGQPRSGSTLAFNIARRLAERFGTVSEVGGATASRIQELLDWEAENPTDAISVFKCHYFIPMPRHFYNVKLIYTCRNPLDVLTSSMRVPEKAVVFEKMGPAPFIGGLEFDYSHFCSMINLPLHTKTMCRYEDFYNDTNEGLALQISILMGFHTSTGMLQEIVDEFSKEKMKQIGDAMFDTAAKVYPETHIRAGHVSKSFGAPGSWRGNLSPELEERVRHQFKMWMKECFWR